MSKFVSEDSLIKQKEFVVRCNEILKERGLFGKLKFFIHSYGCLGNVSDGEIITGLLEQIGLVKVETVKEANFVVLNTCAIRESAQERVIGNLGLIIHLKKENPNLKIVLCGCMMQQEHVINRIKTVFCDVNLIFGPHEIYRIPELFFKMLNGSKKVFSVSNSQGEIAEGLPVSRGSEFKALVPISYGCNNFCSYCVVPYVKGRERSRKIEDVLNEVKNLIAAGFCEITLLGQNVNSYGSDLGLKNGFVKLLYLINDVPGKFIVRFQTSNPKDADFELFNAMRECKKVCPSLHLPVQSGCDRILKAMNRKYTVEKYEELVELAKNVVPNLELTSDIIVGFPSEVYSEFKQTVNLIKKVNFASLFTFIFSPRKQTKAAEMDDFISKKEKAEWLNELVNEQNEISLKVNGKYVGKEEEILIEKRNCKTGLLMGRTKSGIQVEVTGSEELVGSFCKVRINSSTRTKLNGEIIS